MDTVYTKSSVKKLPTSLVASLDNNSVISFYTAVRVCPSNQNVIYHATKYLIYNVYFFAKVEAWLYSQGKITATNSEINYQTKM